MSKPNGDIEPAVRAPLSMPALSWLDLEDRGLDFNGPVSVPFEPFTDQDVESSIFSRFERIADRFSEKPAVDDGALRLTYGELQNAVHRLASQVGSMAPVGRSVAAVLPSSSFSPIAALACLAAGRPYVPLDSDDAAGRNAERIRDSHAALVITAPTSPGACPQSHPIPAIDIASALGAGTDAGPPAFSGNNSLIILYTSGSTGRPKGIVNAERNILERVRQFTNSCHINPEDRIMLVVPQATIAGMRDTFTALLNGASLYLTNLRRAGIRELQTVLREKRVTAFYAVPTILRALTGAESAARDFESLRLVRIGGEVAYTRDVRKLRQCLPQSSHILCAYSSTEAPAIMQWFVRSRDLDGDRRLPAGYGLPGCSIALVDSEGAPVGPGEVGEIVVGCRYVADGLWSDGKLISGLAPPDPRDPSIRILRTGDMARILSDGLFEITGRSDRQVKVNGVRIDPGEIEAWLRECTGVSDAAVVPSSRAGQVALTAFVVSPDNPKPGAEQLLTALSKHLPRTLLPRRIIHIDAIPRLPGHKPDLQALAKLDEDESHSPSAAPPPPAGDLPLPREIRTAVHRVWAGLLSEGSTAGEKTWREAGGDSLLQLRLILEIENLLKIRLEPEGLSPDVTREGFFAAVANQLNRRKADVDRSHLPTVCLFPGILGDEPNLAALRSRLRDVVRFVVVDYPGVHAMLSCEGGLEPIVHSALRQVHAACPDGPVHLVGYSFGGFVAFEVAQRLVSSGHEIGLLGMLDSYRGISLRPSSGKPETSVSSEGCEGPEKAGRAEALKRLLRGLIGLRAFGALRLILRAPRLPGAEWTLTLPFVLTDLLRQDALRQWKPNPAGPLRATLFRSEESIPGLPYDLGWAAACSDLTIVPVTGSHRSMIGPGHVEHLCSRLLFALGAIGQSSPEVGAGIRSPRLRRV